MPHWGKRKEPPRTEFRIATPMESIIADREIMWTGWIDECTAMQEAFIEGLLTLMPSLEDKDDG